MEKQDKSAYEAPEAQVIELRYEGMICTSDNVLQQRSGYEIINTNPFGI